LSERLPPLRIRVVLATFALVGLVLLGYAAVRLGRGADPSDSWVLGTGIVGLISASYFGLVAGLIVGGGCYLLGRGTGVEGGRGVVLVLMGTGLLAIPFLLVGLFYLATLNA
jgi:hypothetical protein